MSDSTDNWMEQALAIPGALGCAVRLADRTMRMREGDAAFSRDRLQQILRKLADATFLLQQSQVMPERLHWTFEEAELWCLIRPRGVMALIVAAKGADPAPIERALAAFA
jgi:hypothetical protein